MPPIQNNIVPILLALAIATVTAACGCGSASAATVDRGASADPHACCHPKPSGDTDKSDRQREQCFHCQRTLASEASAKLVHPLTLALIGISPSPVARISSPTLFTDQFEPTATTALANSLLYQHCALLL